MQRIIRVDDHEVALSNQHKVLFPADGFTKNDLLIHYTRVAPLMLPLIADHMISMQRFPDGIDHEGFFQKNIGAYFPRWITIKTIPSTEGKRVRYACINNLATLLYIVNQGCITPHAWLSTARAPRKPDRMIFDLDPSGSVTVARLRWLARELKVYLERDGLTPFVMTTGSYGFHVVVPLKVRADFAAVKAYAHGAAEYFVAQFPQYVTLEMQIAKRGNKIFLDVLRNGFGATSVAPYAVRALPGAPVATPLLWSELGVITPQKYTIKNIKRRIESVGDVWHDFYQKATVLPKY